MWIRPSRAKTLGPNFQTLCSQDVLLCVLCPSLPFGLVGPWTRAPTYLNNGCLALFSEGFPLDSAWGEDVQGKVEMSLPVLVCNLQCWPCIIRSMSGNNYLLVSCWDSLKVDSSAQHVSILSSPVHCSSSLCPFHWLLLMVSYRRHWPQLNSPFLHSNFLSLLRTSLLSASIESLNSQWYWYATKAGKTTGL